MKYKFKHKKQLPMEQRIEKSKINLLKGCIQ